MNIENLRGFVTVAETLNFRSAAEQLFLSQPGLSRQIAELEKELGVPLLERTTRSVHLTPAGEACLGSAEGIVRMWDTMHSKVLQTGDSVVALRVGIYGARSTYYVAGVLERFRREYPAIDLQIKTGHHEALTEGLISGDIDLVCMIAPDLVEVPGVERLVLAEEYPSVLVPLGHPLANQPSVSLTKLKRERFLIPSRQKSRHVHDALCRIFAQAGIAPNIVGEEDNDATLVIRVLNGEALGLRPTDWRLSLEEPQWERPAGAIFVPLECDHTPFDRVTAWRKQNKSPALRQFLSILREELYPTQKAD